jgi:hypothetical protein
MAEALSYYEWLKNTHPVFQKVVEMARYVEEGG